MRKENDRKNKRKKWTRKNLAAFYTSSVGESKAVEKQRAAPPLHRREKTASSQDSQDRKAYSKNIRGRLNI